MMAGENVSFRLQATAYSFGRACGVLHRGYSDDGGRLLLLLEQGELASLAFSHSRWQRPAGLIVIDGAPLSHPMIRLLSAGVPVVMVTSAQSTQLPDGPALCIDGGTGLIATADAVEADRTACSPPVPPLGAAVLTRDGVPVFLRASIADVAGAARAVACGASAVGLVRSEFLVPDDNRLPDTAFYQDAVGRLCDAARPLPVTLRLLDLAADKRPPWLGDIPGMEGPLGLQGSRLYGIQPVRRVFHAQLDAVARLSSEFELSLLIPFVARPEEFRRWREEIEQRIPGPLAIGVMAETPAAVLAMSEWSGLADFVAIGCNDLSQCLLAADRDIPQVGELLDPCTPALFRFLNYAAQAAEQNIDRVQLCGLLPQVPHVLPVLIGLGFRAFSVEPRMIPYLAEVVRQTDTQAAAARALAVCRAHDVVNVRTVLNLPLE